MKLLRQSSTIANKYPTNRDNFFKSSSTWLEGKKLDDNAEGLWRIHDKLYDFTDFIKHHPGGATWLEITKGIDITEEFETHHIGNTAERILGKFYVRDAALPRNYKITFHPNGFYKTLKQRVANKLSANFDKNLIGMSRFYCDLMFTSTILSFIYASREYNFFSVLVAASCLMMLTTIIHNFIHQRDNWRMYLMNLNLQSFREVRVIHVLSHHLYPNSLHDLECSLFEPIVNFMPTKKNILQRYVSWIYTPVVYAFIIPRTGIFRIIGSFIHNYKLHWDDLLPFTLPVLMYSFGNVGLGESIIRWLSIIFVSSLIYGYVSVHGSHHHEKIFHDGDTLQSLDFGIYQLAATFDKAEFLQNNFAVLISFGQHVAHHLFPTLDHALLPQLNEIIYDTCKEFEADFIVYPWFKLFIGQYKQLARTEAHTTKLQ